MATAARKALDCLLSTIYYSFGYRSNHRKSYSDTYYSSSRNSSSTYCHFEKNNSTRKMTNGSPLSLQTVELKVRMCCTGCERVVRHAILKLRVEVDLELEKVTVTGYVERNKVLKEVRRKREEGGVLAQPGPAALLHDGEENYFHDEEAFRGSYNYWRHGYKGDKHGHVPVPHRGADAVSNMFNDDDDVNACSVM